MNSARHLLLGATVFPLLVKNLLERHGVFRPTENDRRQVAAFVASRTIFGNPAHSSRVGITTSVNRESRLPDLSASSDRTLWLLDLI